MAKDEKQKEKQSASGSATVRVTEEAAASEKPDIDPVPDVDIDEERRLLAEQGAAAREQAEQRIDNEVEQGVEALRRAEEDAQPGFQSLRDQIAIDERQALDNQALYAEMRGDRGGIGQAQFASIQNTAAVNRRQVGLEQQRLAAETARQIEDLRRQGEFRKADMILELTQKQLSELMELERWAKEKNLSVAQFNTELARWEAEYAWKMKRFGIETELNLAQLSGLMPDGTPTFAARQAERSRLAAAAKMLLEAGLALTPEQLEALGWTEGQYEAYINQNSSGGGSEAAPKPGVPFQLLASWASALRGSEKPEKAYAKIKSSPMYAQMSEAQQRWISGILRERGIG
ncbi:MAG: hypothetical protein IJL51_01455 [Oscillospiraceae bacterium]|nr:hypothetical protein [Oscillospiraceae bacterium]